MSKMKEIIKMKGMREKAPNPPLCIQIRKSFKPLTEAVNGINNGYITMSQQETLGLAIHLHSQHCFFIVSKTQVCLSH